MSITNRNVYIDNLNVYNNTFIPSNVCFRCNQNKALTEYNKSRPNLDKLRS